MKKLLFALSLILTIQLSAQTKEAADALKEIAKHKAIHKILKRQRILLHG